MRPLCLALGLMFAVGHGPAAAGPVGPQVMAGSATFSRPDARTYDIRTGNGTIINWQGFSIGPGESARFFQPSAQSAVLNRVIGPDPSSIQGQLWSNGRVFLVNPNGIIFGPGALVDTASFIASTLGIGDADFLAGRLRFAGNGDAGGIVNQGVLRAGANGHIFLIAPNIENSGSIETVNGRILLAAGRSVILSSMDLEDVRFEVQAPTDQVVNLGSLRADGGAINVFAGTLRHSGEMRADTVSRDARGNIVLLAQKDITLEAGSVISASGAPGGVHDGGSVRIVADGTLDLQRGAAVHVDGGIDGGNGGALELSGKQAIALNGTYTGLAHKAGYSNGSLRIDPSNINLIADLAVAATITMSANFPMPVVVSPDGSRVYIGGAGVVHVVDTATNALVASIPVAGSYWLAVKPDGTRVYAISNASPGTLSVIDTATNTVIATAATGNGANHISVSPDGSKAFITNGSDSRLTVLNTATNTTTLVNVGSGGSISAVTPNGAFVYADNGASNSVSVINAATNAVTATIGVGANPQWVVVRPDGARAYTANFGGNSVSVINTATNTVVATVPVGINPRGLVTSPDGSRLYVLNGGGNSVSVVNTATNTVAATIPVGANPGQIAISADGAQVYTANQNANTVSVIDTATNAVTRTIAVGLVPTVPAVAPGGTAYIGNRGGSLSVITPAAPGATTGGVVTASDNPGTTLNLAPAALSGAWANVSLAATNDINVGVALASTDIPTGGTLTLAAGHDLNVNAAIGSFGARFDHSLTLDAGNSLAINQAIFLNGNALIARGASVNLAAAVDSGNGSVVLQPGVAATIGANLTAGSGSIAVAGSGVVNFSAAPVISAASFSAGTLNVGSATVTLNATTAATNLAIAGGTLNGSGTLAVVGALDSSGSSTIGKPLVNGGAMQVNGGSLALTAPGGYLQIGASTTLLSSTLSASSITLAGGVLAGNGTINGNVFNSAGIVRPGTSPGTLVINGNYSQGPSGSLEVELGGFAQGATYDWLRVSGTASFGGALNVALYGGFTPSLGNVFDVISYGGASGNFATLNLPTGYAMGGASLSTGYQLLVGGIPVTSAPQSPLPQELVQSNPASQFVQMLQNDEQVASTANALAGEDVSETFGRRRLLPVCR